MYSNHDLYESLIAKTNKDNTQEWLPLWMHSTDCAETMVYLTKNWVADSVKNTIGLTEEVLYKTVYLLGYLHDIGKATSYFQSLISENLPEKRNHLNYLGLNILPLKNYLSVGDTPHSHAGQWILSSNIIDYSFDDSFLNIIGAHHGMPIDLNEKNGSKQLEIYCQNFFGDFKFDENWMGLWNEIVATGINLSGFLSVEEVPKLSPEAQVLLSGLLIVADWIASNVYYFPLIDCDSDGIDIEYSERINFAFNKLNFPDKWQSNTFYMDSDIFQEKFGFMPNDVQSQFLNIVNNVEEPGVYIIESTMGSGKTEAALAGTDVLSNRFNEDGIFWGMPTQVTSNGLFPRLLQWAETESKDEDEGLVHSIRLAHGAAKFNQQYKDFMFQGKSLTQEDEEGGIRIHPWFEGRKKALLADFVVGTIDQFLMAALRRKHFMLRHFGLASKVIVIDECHAYDTYMNQYLSRALTWMGAYGIPVILLSATLPKKRRVELINAYEKAYARYNLGDKKIKPEIISSGWESSITYPLITWTDGSKINQVTINTVSKNKNVFIKNVYYSKLIDKVSEKLQDGGCAVLIFNTVRHAQETYQAMMKLKEMSDKYIVLYHSQFTYPDRQKKEETILKLIGKSSTPKERNGTIVIGTQVLEQSLDYDADIMFSELCPMDLLFQRMGRLHRHDRKNRPLNLNDSQFYIIQDDEKNYDDGTKSVYGDYLLLRTKKLLPKEINVPEYISPLVQKTYDENDDLEMNDKRYIEAKQQNNKKQEKLKALADVYRLPRPMRQGLANMLSNANEFNEREAEASVRNGDMSIEVVLLKKIDEETIGLVDENNDVKFLSNIVPSLDDAQKISFQRIRLPHVLTMKWNIEKTIHELEQFNKQYLSSWQESPWLKGELVLLLNEKRYADLNGYRLFYNKDIGLTYKRKE